MSITNNMNVGQTLLRNLNNNNAAAAKSVKAISSGYRINSAKDDASGLAVAKKRMAELSGISAASRNVQDAVSMVRTADDVLGNVNDIAGRMNELAVKAGNGTLGGDERSSLQAEFTQLAKEIDRAGEASKFNGNPLFDGSSYTIQTGAGSGNAVDVSMQKLSAASLGLSDVDLSSPERSGQAQRVIKDATKQISTQRGKLGAAENALQSTFNNLETNNQSLTDSLSKIMDVSISKESINRNLSTILSKTSAAMLNNSQHLVSYNALQLLL